MVCVISREKKMRKLDRSGKIINTEVAPTPSETSMQPIPQIPKQEVSSAQLEPMSDVDYSLYRVRMEEHAATFANRQHYHPEYDSSAQLKRVTQLYEELNAKIAEMNAKEEELFQEECIMLIEEFTLPEEHEPTTEELLEEARERLATILANEQMDEFLGKSSPLRLRLSEKNKLKKEIELLENKLRGGQTNG